MTATRYTRGVELLQASHIVLFGGTFDPPTFAHARLPDLVREQIGADLVAYIPAAQSPLKLTRPPTAPAHRLEMLQLSLNLCARAVILTDELDRAAAGEPSYTVDTVRALKTRLKPGVKLRLLIGADQYRLFDQWRDAAEIVRMAEPLVMVRPPETRESLLRAPPKIGTPPEWASRLIEVPSLAVSSTAVRERVAAGMPIDGLVPPAVAAYIATNGLYR